MSVQGKTIVITGATSGIGAVAARELAGQGARIVFIARDKTRGEATLSALKGANPSSDHRMHLADLSSLVEMKRVANAILSDEPHVDVLINNAGAVLARSKRRLARRPRASSMIAW